MQAIEKANNHVFRWISPDDAKEMLGTMQFNRRIKGAQVDRLVKDIKAGKFVLSPMPICFDENGHLVDGQHRLTACIKADKAIPSYILYNVPSDAVIDRGVPRSTGDALYLAGRIPNDVANTRAVALANHYLEMTGVGNRTDNEICNILTQYHDQIVKTISVSYLKVNNTRKLCVRAPVQTAILGALLSGVPENTLGAFAMAVNSGFISSEKESAAIVLRNYLIQARSFGRNPRQIMCAYAQMAIKDYVNGNPRKTGYKGDLTCWYTGGRKYKANEDE